ncbi:MAG: hypothetical protein KF768_09825 [Phycisphaeraceae bacterium]|nr:hypothetical protein [Phycisphaeraceae bacterium]
MSTRVLLWLGFAASVLLFLAAAVGMAFRIDAFNRHANFARFNIHLISDRAFEIPGFPSVRLVDVGPSDSNAEGSASDSRGSFLRLEFADHALLIPVRSPPVENAPNLAIYDEWVKVMAITEMRRSESSGYSEPIEDGRRLMIVTRTTPPGYDPRSWGSVRRSEWVFTFYNLESDGTIRVEKRRWPRKRRGEQTLQRLAADGDESTGGERERYRELAAIEPLSERTVEYFAAMHVIPKLNVPSYKFSDTAFSFSVLGWTAPVAGLSVLGMCGTLIFALAPMAKRPDQDASPRASRAA